MNVTVILLALILGLAPLLAGLLDVLTTPEALADVFNARVLSLWGGTVLLGLATAASSMLVGVPVGWTVARCQRTGWVVHSCPCP